MKMPELLKWVGVGLLAVLVAAAVFYWINRGSQVRLEGRIAKARVVATDDNACVVILELHLRNPASVPFWIQEVRMTVAGSEGIRMVEADLDRMLDYYKVEGPRYNPVLKAREKIGGGQALDRTVAAGFQMSAAAAARTPELIVRVADVDGAETEIRGPWPR
jgi:hypothetical protein